ncbi:WSSV095 [White spot syndrome virus]|uniref:WSSV095 n=1 Tax=White spot syndrome virus TaxID=342409 RepID=A0A2I6SBK9_9VIRU|nr:WSSV095 [White spot syndrome virus]
MVSQNNINNNSNNNGNGTKTTVDPVTGDIVITNATFPDTRPLYTAANGGTSSFKWGDINDRKMHKAFPTFFIGNPTAAATANGVPLTSEGISLTEEKQENRRHL